MAMKQFYPFLQSCRRCRSPWTRSKLSLFEANLLAHSGVVWFSASSSPMSVWQRYKTQARNKTRWYSHEFKFLPANEKRERYHREIVNMIKNQISFIDRHKVSRRADVGVGQQKTNCIRLWLKQWRLGWWRFMWSFVTGLVKESTYQVVTSHAVNLLSKCRGEVHQAYVTFFSLCRRQTSKCGLL